MNVWCMVQTTVFINTEWVSNQHNMNILHETKNICDAPEKIFHTNLELPVSGWSQRGHPVSILHPSCVQLSPGYRVDHIIVDGVTGDVVVCPVRRRLTVVCRCTLTVLPPHLADGGRRRIIIVMQQWSSTIHGLTDWLTWQTYMTRTSLSWMDHTFTSIVLCL